MRLAGRERPGSVRLTRREREIVGHLAEGMSGAEIAELLVLSPETVRTHVRNAMAKLGASTRSQAVALALQRREITGETGSSAGDQPPATAPTSPTDPASALKAMVDALVGLYDVDAGAIYLVDEDGFLLLRVAEGGGGEFELPPEVALGDGALGRAALERRAQLLQGSAAGSSGHGAVIAVPMVSGGRLLGVIALVARDSRPIGRSELLLLQAFANRVGEVVLAGGDVERRLVRSIERFQASWSSVPRLA